MHVREIQSTRCLSIGHYIIYLHCIHLHSAHYTSLQNVLLGQICPVGTGTFKLLLDTQSIRDAIVSQDVAQLALGDMVEHFAGSAVGAGVCMHGVYVWCVYVYLISPVLLLSGVDVMCELHISYLIPHYLRDIMM
jgi:hypothetical protein